MTEFDRTQANWGIVISKQGTDSHFETHLEAAMDEHLSTLKDRWESDEEPSEELSIMAAGAGETIYIGRYPEGVVVRLNDRNNQITFLTNEQAAELGNRLLGKQG